MTTTKSLRSIITLSLALATLLGYSFINAAWTPAPANPPANNVPAAINVGSANQDKLGTLGVNGLAVFGSQLIESGTPTISLFDNTASSPDYRLRVDANALSIQSDVDSDGTFDSTASLRLVTSIGFGAETSATFANQVRAEEFCDKSGLNCFSAGGISAYNLNVLEAGQEGWNSFNPTPYPAVDTTSMATYPVCFLTTNLVVAREDNDLTAAGGCTLTNDGTTWSLQATGAKRTTTTCRASCLGG